MISRIKELFAPVYEGPMPGLYERAARAMRTGLTREGARAVTLADDEYELHINNTDEQISPVPGIVLDPGAIGITNRGYPTAIMYPEGCCVLCAKEDIATIVKRLLDGHGGSQ